MTNKKFSLSILNSLLLIAFLIVVALSILISTYFNTQKVIDKNINDYFNQTYNLTKLLVDNEMKSLESNENEIIYTLALNSSKDYDVIENLEVIDNVDLVFIKEGEEVLDFSSSLFDTEDIIKEINNLNLPDKEIIVSVDLNDENIVLLLSNKKIVDNETGRVRAKLFIGKILNDNFSFLNEIKQKAKLEDVFLLHNNKVIASSSNKYENINFKAFDEKPIIIESDFVYSSKLIDIYNNKYIDFVFVSKNSVFDILKDSFINQAIFLLLFIILSFLLLYFLSTKYIINPFSKLLNFAHNIKDNKDIRYEQTQVLEFDQFALELNDIINELKDVKEQYSRAIDGVQDGLWDVDVKNRKVYFSTRFKTMLGYNINDNINYFTFWQRSIHKDDYKKTMLRLKKHLALKTEIFENEYRFRCKDKSYKWIKVRGKLFFDENGNANRMTGFHTDISDLIVLQEENRKKEQMLYQQSKLAAMGEMIGNIAHQWRQPLTVISVIASTISMQSELGIEDKESTKKDLKKILDTVNYLSSIIDKFRYFFNPDNKVETFYFKEAIKENMEIFESSYKSNNIDLILDLDDVEINGYKFELMQVIINIINNSKDALIEKMLKNDSRKLIFMSCKVKDNELTIRIYDNAGGIPVNVRDKIYEPYFTTKHQSQGTGLGLYMSNEIIQKHFNGKIENKTIEYIYEDQNYKGEEFLIKLPI